MNAQVWNQKAFLNVLQHLWKIPYFDRSILTVKSVAKNIKKK